MPTLTEQINELRLLCEDSYSKTWKTKRSKGADLAAQNIPKKEMAELARREPTHRFRTFKNKVTVVEAERKKKDRWGTVTGIVPVEWWYEGKRYKTMKAARAAAGV